MKKGTKIALISAGSAIGLLIGIILLVLAFGGMIAKQVVEKHSPEWVGRQITLDRPLINLFACSVRLTNVSMSEAPVKTWEKDGEKQYDFVGSSEFAHFDTLYVQINPFRLLRKEIWLNHIWLIGPNATIVRTEQAFNFQDIIDHFASDPDKEMPQEEPQEEGAGWGIGLYDIRLHRGAVGYEDHTFGSQWGMENINIEVPGVYLGKDQTEAGVALDFPDGNGSLTIGAHYDMETQTYSAQLDMDTVKLDMALPVAKRYVNLSKIGSSLSGSIHAEGNLDSITAVRLSGELNMNGTDLRNNDDGPLLSLAHVGVRIKKVDLGQMLVDVDQIEINGLNTTFERWDDRNTFSNILPASPADNETTTGQATADDSSTVQTKADSKPLQLVVHNVVVSDVNMTYKDHTLQSPFSYTISHLGIEAKDVTLTGENNVRLHAELPRGGSIMASWKGGMNIKQDNEHLTLTVKNMQLKDFSPWCEEYTATPITGGSLSITSENRLNAGKLRGTNKVDIYSMMVDKKKQMDAPYKAVPVKLAIGLLADLNHKIAISLPVSGDINSPKFSYSKIIWQTVGNVLLKAVASPWVALGEAMGLGGEDLSKLEIDPLQPDFTSEQYAKIDKLVEMMRQEEELSLQMTQQFNLEQAIRTQGIFNLKRAYYESQYGAVGIPSLADIENIKEIRERDKGFAEYVEHLCQTNNLSAKQSLEEIGTAYYTTDSLQAIVMQLAEIRNRTLSNYLTQQQGLPAQRVKITTAASDALREYSGKEKYEVGSDVSAMEQSLGQ